jgi:hypothetical protein
MSNTRSKDLKLVPLFGKLDDMRSKLFISALREASDKIRGSNSYKATKITKAGVNYGIQGNIYLSEVTYHFKNKYFMNKDSTIGDDDIHSEWKTYINNISARINNATYTKTPTPTSNIGKNIIDLIESVNGNVLVGSEEEFTQELIKMLVESGTRKMPDGTIQPIDMSSPSTWTNIESVTYYRIQLILAKLMIGANTLYNRFSPAIFTLMTGADRNIDTIPLENKQAYENFILNSLSIAGSPLPDNQVKFNLNLTKYWLLEQLDEHFKNAKQPINNSSSFFDKDTPAVQEQYFRKDGKLYTFDSDGNEVHVDVTSVAYRKLSDDSTKCLDTGFKDSTSGTGQTCADYLHDCLQGKGVEKCKAFLQNQDFWKITQDEVNNMLPVNAVKTLTSFGFEFYSTFDAEAGRKFKKVYDVNKWIENLAEKAKSGTSPGLSIADVENITKNLKLTGYLGMIVHKINSNPAILNDDYVGPNNINQINSQSFDTTLSKIGLKPRYAVQTLSVGDITKFQNAVTDNYRYIKALFRIPGVGSSIFNAGMSGRMVGGGTDLIDTFEERLSDKTKYISHIIANHHISLNKRLERFGKKIDTNDQKKISDLIDNLAESESKLYKASLYAEKYAQLLELHGNNDSTSVLNYDHLKEFVDHRNKYFDRVSKKQLDLISIIRSIAEAVNNETLQKSQKKSQHEPVDIESINTLLLG